MPTSLKNPAIFLTIFCLFQFLEKIQKRFFFLITLSTRYESVAAHRPGNIYIYITYNCPLPSLDVIPQISLHNNPAQVDSHNRLYS